jgi:Rieske Fe-S protein
MSKIIGTLSRRSLLRLVSALPVVKLLERYLGALIGCGEKSANAATVLNVVKVSQLSKPWSSKAFEYFVRVKMKSTEGDTVNEEHLPGLVIRLPDDIAAKRGGGSKGKFQVVSLYCTHQRCKTAFVSDPAEVEAMMGVRPEGPVFYCGCHQSLFDVAQDAKPVLGPAKEPLWKFEFDIKGDDIVVTGVDPKAAVWNPGRAGGLSSEYPVRPQERGL